MTQNTIVNAPSKWSLAVAFFDRIETGRPGGERRPVTFTVEGPSFNDGRHPLHVVINELQWEDGSGESWCFSGYITGLLPTIVPDFSSAVRGWFRTSDRKGWIQLDLPKPK